jgi:glycosyltransferase involved in cell wall biosynthesis
MLVGLVTNYGDQCSIAEYAKNLYEQFPMDDVQLKIVGHPLDFDSVFLRTRDVDVIHINHIGYWMPKDMLERLHNARKMNQKIVITYQETPSDLGEQFADMVVLHEPSGSYSNKVRLIPNGIRLVDVTGITKENKIGSAGFYSAPKGFPLVANAAIELGLGCLLLMPKAVCGTEAVNFHGAEIVKDYLLYDDVVRRLAECMVTIFPYDSSYPNVGIGNAVRFGLAAGGAVAVTRHHHFRDLFAYPDEIYFIDNESVSSVVQKVLRDKANNEMKVPKRLLADMSWTKCAQMYADIYRELMVA